MRTVKDFLEFDHAPHEGKPFGWVQHKGSRLCIDLHCICGASPHYDGDFLYQWRCVACGRVYKTGACLAMYEMTPEEAAACGDDFIKDMADDD